MQTFATALPYPHTKTAAECLAMEKPYLPGYVVLAREPGANAYSGVIEGSFSLGHSSDRTQFFWSSDNATSNFGGSFKVDGEKMARETVEYWSKKHPEMSFEMFDVHGDNLPVAIDWDEWRYGKQPSKKTLSGVVDKFIARNPRFFMLDA